jgi:uncharacterized damage-inducible protein DinB
MSLSIPADELLRWNDLSATHWHGFALANPGILTLPCDIHSSHTVAQLLQHIVAVELRYAQRLAGEPESDYNDIPFHSAEAIFATHDRTLSLLQPLLADAAFNWSTEIEFQTITAGRIRASRRTILIHLLMHSIRHYAQLATLVRTHGFNPDWPMDFLFVAAHPA